MSTIVLHSTLNISETGIVLFSVPRNGNQGLENAIFRPWKAENKELRSLFSIPGDGQLAYSMIFWP